MNYRKLNLIIQHHSFVFIFSGDIVFIKDHVNLHTENPLRGENDKRLSSHFPDMLKTYDRVLTFKALQIAEKHSAWVHEVVVVEKTEPKLTLIVKELLKEMQKMLLLGLFIF